MNTIQINDQVVWDNTKKLHEQTLESQSWYNENIAPRLSWAVSASIKQMVADRLGLEGEVIDEPTEEGKIIPTFDGFGRPVKWKFYHDDKYLLEVENKYLFSSPNWNMDYQKVTITEIL